MKPGPKVQEWRSDWLAVVYFVMRCLHDEEHHWTYDRITEFAWDLYAWRLTRREFEHIAACKKSLLEFGTKRRKLLSLKC